MINRIRNEGKACYLIAAIRVIQNMQEHAEIDSNAPERIDRARLFKGPKEGEYDPRYWLDVVNETLSKPMFSVDERGDCVEYLLYFLDAIKYDDYDYLCTPDIPNREAVLGLEKAFLFVNIIHSVDEKGEKRPKETTNKSPENLGENYDLIGFVTHGGSRTDRGRYSYYKRSKEGLWIKQSKGDYNHKTLETIPVYSKAVLFVYKRREHDPLKRPLTPRPPRQE